MPAPNGQPHPYDQYPAMSNGGHDMYYPHHMSAGPAPPPQTVAAPYSHPPAHSQSHPPPMQPAPGPYPPPQYGNQYAYPNGLTPPAGPPVSNPLAGPQPVLPLPGVSQPGMAPAGYSNGFDVTGQIAPPGMKPRVTATLWEDEGSLCFQVEARGICVARRDDNAMINGTKLLNVAGMTRGRRDGILKSEKIRHVVKIGPMHLKGVWIPYERALDFANKEKITELLYPLFVHNINQLLCHPANQGRSNQAMAAAQRKQQENMRSTQPPPPANPGLPSLPQHHLALPGPPHPQLPSHPPPPSMVRPSLDRSHSFPTPPTSAHEHDGEYTHGSAPYHSNRNPYTSSLQNDHPATPRTVAAPQPYYVQPYNPPQAPVLSGVPTKRGRDDDSGDRDIKRRKVGSISPTAVPTQLRG
ncbi:uncharacterized protein C8A04DRAFT_11708 [Dichotomopilus funicola]|uniref:HTH APSES-type domain-containing protein n=1 Tax=Dichotomopilus funicola TaxID=1934379 RepID=A0AAN6V4D1_9PEZI|nr:hypothetical protein C8A04DRAFT_11708 [Dichotomopilus funicola]